MGFSILGLDLENIYHLKDKVRDICEKEKIKCIFRVNINKFKRLNALKENHVLYVARNISEAKFSKAPFYLLEAGKNIYDTLKVKEFCERKSNINFVIEFDFAFLRLYDDFLFTNYLNCLTKLMSVCKRRHILTIFSSMARNYNELVPPRVLYNFYKILGGSLSLREILHDIPKREMIDKLDLGPKYIW
ncbi:MAG: hypothetical protein QXL52_03580 [Nitrososphaerales archaeon]